MCEPLSTTFRLLIANKFRLLIHDLQNLQNRLNYDHWRDYLRQHAHEANALQGEKPKVLLRQCDKQK